MQIVLTEDVPNVGKQGDLVEVRHGYGRNYLLPNGLATIPSEHNVRLVERYKERVRQAREARIADLKALAEQIQRANVTIEANANEEGHLYGSVGAPEISKALKALNLQVEPDMVRLEGPIRECALFAVKLNLGYEIETEVKILVVRQQERK
jgi:large subunit ribosomal protein L9